MNSKPVILFVDDEPHNLTVFEASLPSEWSIHTFDNPIRALEEIEKINPWVVISDQRMPSMKGVSFLEMCRKLCPNAVRIIVTGYSDEDLVVESVRKAQIYDYIRKPWDPDDLLKSLERAVDYFQSEFQRKLLQEELLKREAELQKQTVDLLRTAKDLEDANKREKQIRAELECWVPPFVLWALEKQDFSFPIKKDIVGITFDIISSGKIHGQLIGKQSLRALIIQTFSELIIKHGGWRESHSGDSAYGHFGLFEENENPSAAALAVAREFRVALRGIASVHKLNFECGIALHVAKDSVVDIHKVQLATPKGIVTQKSFDTSSVGVDMLHKIEKLVHKLSGSNIIITQEFLDSLPQKTQDIIQLGEFAFSDAMQPQFLYLIPSDKTNQSEIETLKNEMHATLAKSRAA